MNRGAAERARELVCLVAVLLLAMPGGAFGYESPLRSPVNVAAQRQAFHRSAGAVVCPIPAPLPAALETIRYYTDPANSVIDPALEAEQRQRDAPVRAAEEALATAVTGFVQTDGAGAAGYGDCILEHLRRFAQDGAFLDTTQFRGTGSVRLVSTTPVMAYVVLRDGGTIPAGDNTAIRAWIAHLAELVLDSERRNPYGNNISYWAGAALAMAAVALDQPRYLDAALAIARTVEGEVDADGALPRETARGDRALEYNLFATQALTTIGIVAEANGVDLFHEHDAALLRLMRTLAASVVTPERFLAISHNPQSITTDKIYRQNLAWLVIYRRLTHDDSVVPMICHVRPLYVFRAGGDWFALVGSEPALCSSVHGSVGRVDCLPLRGVSWPTLAALG